MGILRLTLRNMRHSALATALTILLVALGAGLISTIEQVSTQAERTFRRGACGNATLILGPKGSSLELMLNVVYYLDRPNKSISYAFYEEIRKKDVEYAIPLALGDYYRGFRVVGTSREIFALFKHSPRKKFSFSSGRPFEKDLEVVLGVDAAKANGLSLGSTFVAVCGYAGTRKTRGGHHEHPFRVVGVLERTGTPHDRAVFCSLADTYRMHGKELPARPERSRREEEEDEAGHEHGEDEEHAGGELRLTAILVRLKHPIAKELFRRRINDGPEAQAVDPTVGARDLFGIVRPIRSALLAISLLVLVSSGVSILVSLYNSMERRQREIAIMRAIGARGRVVFATVVLEAAAIAFVGALGGILLSHLAVGLFASALSELARIPVGFTAPTAYEALLVLGATLLGVVSGLIPAIRAYRTDVAAGLRPLA